MRLRADLAAGRRHATLASLDSKYALIVACELLAQALAARRMPG